MSTATQGIDARAYLGGWLNGLTNMYVSDINAIPEDKWTATFGGCTRPASELTADAISLLDWTAEAMKGNIRNTYGEEINAMAKAECATKAGAIAKFQASTAAFAEALG